MSADVIAPGLTGVRARLESLPALPEVDHAAFGEIETIPLSRIQTLTAGFLARNWVSIPHVTHDDEADITDLETLRQSKAAAGTKLTTLPFLIKAAVAALKTFPRFNASLDPNGKTLVLKKYFHIGIAVDTPQGLLVPVLQDCDKKPVEVLAAELAERGLKARAKGLSLAEMSGGCFTISSLGHIGGTGFTPIINAPEVAILGVTKAQWRQQRVGDTAVWRLMLPLSLSYDHRAVNGADAARFCRLIADRLADCQSLSG